MSRFKHMLYFALLVAPFTTAAAQSQTSKDTLPASTTPQSSPTNSQTKQANPEPASEVSESPLLQGAPEPTGTNQPAPAPEILKAPSTQNTEGPAAPSNSTAPEIDPETLAKIEEARRRILQEEAEKKEKAIRENRESLAKNQKAKSSFWAFLMNDTEFRTGVMAGPGLSLNQMHAGGFSIAGLLEFRFKKHYGIRFTAETGTWSNRAFNFKSGDYTLPQVEGGSLGFLLLSPSFQYTLPEFSPVEFAIGAGPGIYYLNGGNFSLGSLVATQINISGFYTLWRGIDVGLVASFLFGSAETIIRNETPYVLDNRENLANLSAKVAIRYRIF